MAQRPSVPYGEIIIILLGLLLTVGLLISISKLLTVGCGNFRKGLALEGFDDYNSKLEIRLNALDKSIDNSNGLIDKITEMADSFNSNICYVTKQIDDSLMANYVSNVPEAESKLPEDIRQKRMDERKVKSKKYVANLKTNYAKSKKMQMIECFQNESDNLSSRIENTKNNLQNLTLKFKEAKKQISDKQLGIYFVSLAYNDKYIRQSIKVANSLNEGFTDTVIDFSKLPVNSEEGDSTDVAPISKIELFEDSYDKLSKNINLLGEKVQIINNTINLQKKNLKESTVLVNDEQAQKNQMMANFSKQQGS